MGFTATLRKCSSVGWVMYVHHVNRPEEGQQGRLTCWLILLAPVGSLEPETEGSVRTGSLCCGSLAHIEVWVTPKTTLL